MLRYSLRNVFVAVTLIAIGCAALMQTTFFWASAVWTLTLTVLASSLLGCLYCRGQSRAFAVGFALFGWSHLFLFAAPWLDTRVGALLFTRTMVDAAAAMLRHQVDRSVLTNSIWEFFTLANQQLQTTNPLFDYLYFLVVGQSIMTLAVGLAGGWIGRYLAGRQS